MDMLKIGGFTYTLSRKTDIISPCIYNSSCLIDRCLCVHGGHIGHRLYANGKISAERCITYLSYGCLASFISEQIEHSLAIFFGLPIRAGTTHTTSKR